MQSIGVEAYGARYRMLEAAKQYKSKVALRVGIPRIPGSQEIACPPLWGTQDSRRLHAFRFFGGGRWRGGSRPRWRVQVWALSREVDVVVPAHPSAHGGKGVGNRG
eukprot:366540-Chlamydomonas_euryale.AAC.4